MVLGLVSCALVWGLEIVANRNEPDRYGHTWINPTHESQRTRSPATEATEQDSLFGSVNSGCELCALCDKNIFTKSVMDGG